jgi:NADH-quinone oxidoreductase subunit C
MSRRSQARLRIRAQVPEDDPVIDSVVGLFPTANWPEREVFDLFGIHFAGHPDLKRILLPDDWDGHPLRKDYPIGAEEVQFSFNQEAIAEQYPHTLEEREERYFVAHQVNN